MTNIADGVGENSWPRNWLVTWDFVWCHQIFTVQSIQMCDLQKWGVVLEIWSGKLEGINWEKKTLDRPESIHFLLHLVFPCWAVQNVILTWGQHVYCKFFQWILSCLLYWHSRLFINGEDKENLWQGYLTRTHIMPAIWYFSLGFVRFHILRVAFPKLV